MQKHCLKAAAALWLALAGAGLAQETELPPQGAEGRVVYEPDFYAQFAPRTALDMIRRTPGFTLREGAARRGFSGAVGNVLIDGERPSAKSQALSDILQRIPAAQVLRIEILRGADVSGDASGHAMLANVVRTPSAGQGVWSLGAEYAGRRPAPNGWGAWSGRVGAADYNFGVNGYSLVRDLPGERVERDGAGDLLRTRRVASPRNFHEATVNGEVARAALGGRARLTGQAHFERYHQDETITTFSPEGAPTGDELNPYTERELQLEAGLNFERALGLWDMTLAGLVTRKRFESGAGSTQRSADGAVYLVFAQEIERNSGESILRGTLARDFSPRHRLEAGVEGAFNTLDAFLLRTLDLGDGSFALPVPNSNLSVEEIRGEAFATYTWRPDARWSVEAKLAGEASRLSFEGDANQQTKLAYLKPSFQIARKLGGRHELRARLYRDASQLDFNDFVSAASFSDNLIEGGNPDLRPETSWRAELAADLRFSEDAALSLTLFRYWIDDAIDLVPVGPEGDQVDAPGNIGAAEVVGFKAALRAPLRPFITGGSLTVDAVVQDAETTDPLTGARRAISNFAETELKIGFRQDLTARKVAWGINYEDKPYTTRFRRDETETSRESPSLDMFIETTAISGLKLQLTAVSVLGSPERRERVFFAPDRNGVIDRIERQERLPGHFLLFSVSGAL